ncbi:MAG: 6-methylsalicylate decarboxylase [Thermoleophilaceae bacterium]|nr:6-methylsalicylate decarboxylase [Thermoleophilaceae bacterium]
MGMRIDCHQHVWTEPLIAALASRSERPRVRRAGGGWRLELDGEADYPIGPDDLMARVAEVDGDGVDLALVAPSLPAGIASAEALAGAYVEGAAALPERFRAWGSVAVVDPDPVSVDAQLGEGFVGIALPAGALAGPAQIERCAPVLERLERRDAPLFVHPGPADPAPGAPAWWPALTDYVAQMNAAWHAFVAFGREQFPSLRVAFALLAGLAPLHIERLRARGGPADQAIDRNLFYDTSSYGPRSLDAMVRVVGIDQLVYGSDRPLATPPPCPLGEAARHATLVTNPARLLRRSAP